MASQYIRCYYASRFRQPAASVQYPSVPGDGQHLPGYEPAAFPDGRLGRSLEAAAAGDLHADYRDALYIVVSDDLRELFGIIRWGPGFLYSYRHGSFRIYIMQPASQ